ncbi:outer membrane beta-barrel protein [Pedobacter sp. AW31-3R]|uniref:outer membrane beta-barrel protein n=1 Tax=Pedobacter sp. AW31-3R TaxID=3445781 RepID=UPI003F9EE89C
MKDERIEHIKAKLEELEFDYRPGAWEEFRARKNKQHKIVQWKRISVAACLFIALFLLGPDRISQHPNTTTFPTAVKIIPKDPPIMVGEHGAGLRRPAQPLGLQAMRSPLLIAGTTNHTDLAAAIEKQPIADTSVHQHPENNVVSVIVKTPAHKKMSMEEFLEQESLLNAKKTRVAPDEKKWSFGLMLGRAIDSRSKANLNLGIQVSYAVNRKLAISSGIHYNELGGAKKIQQPAGFNIENSSRKLESTQASMTGIEIPLELQYRISKKIYAGLGLSAYSILSQKQILTYSQDISTVSSYIDAAGQERMQVINYTQESTEFVPGEKLRQNKYVALYNLSVGFQQKISKRNTLSFEPYVKLPVSSYAEQKLHLGQAGLHIKVDF